MRVPEATAADSDARWAWPAGQGCRGPCELRDSVEERYRDRSPHSPPWSPGLHQACDSRRLDPIRGLRGSFLHHPRKSGCLGVPRGLKGSRVPLGDSVSPAVSTLSLLCLQTCGFSVPPAEWPCRMALSWWPRHRVTLSWWPRHGGQEDGWAVKWLWQPRLAECPVALRSPVP